MQLDPGGGSRRLVVLPGRAADLAVGAAHVYVPHLDGHVVWVVDRRGGGLIDTIAVGRRPVALAVSSGDR